MTLWFLFALMTAAAIFAVLWPLSRAGRPHSEGSEAAVYKDQIAEIDRDLATGLIGYSEAEAARVEISRRLLAAVDREPDPPKKRSARHAHRPRPQPRRPRLDAGRHAFRPRHDRQGRPYGARGRGLT